MRFKTNQEAYAYAAEHKLRVVTDNTLTGGKRVLDALTADGKMVCLTVPLPKKETKSDKLARARR